MEVLYPRVRGVTVPDDLWLDQRQGSSLPARAAAAPCDEWAFLRSCAGFPSARGCSVVGGCVGGRIVLDGLDHEASQLSDVRLQVVSQASDLRLQIVDAAVRIVEAVVDAAVHVVEPGVYVVEPGIGRARSDSERGHYCCGRDEH